MKLQYRHIILLSVLFFCFSCRKDREVAKYKGDYLIAGRVLDEITGKGVSQAIVGVTEWTGMLLHTLVEKRLPRTRGIIQSDR